MIAVASPRAHNLELIRVLWQVPKYPGSALDPPLRSRFQAREISGYSIGAQYAALRNFVPDMTTNLLRRLLSAVEALRALENSGITTSFTRYVVICSVC